MMVMMLMVMMPTVMMLIVMLLLLMLMVMLMMVMMLMMLIWWWWWWWWVLILCQVLCEPYIPYFINLHNNLLRWSHDFFHFSDEESGAQKVWVTCLQLGSMLGFKSTGLCILLLSDIDILITFKPLGKRRNVIVYLKWKGEHGRGRKKKCWMGWVVKISEGDTLILGLQGWVAF